MINLADLLGQLLARPRDPRLRDAVADYLTDHGHMAQVWALRRQCPGCGGRLRIRREHLPADDVGPAVEIRRRVCSRCNIEDTFFYTDPEITVRRIIRELGYCHRHLAASCTKCRGSRLPEDAK